MKEEITWGKTHDYYKPLFKERGFELKVIVERRGYSGENVRNDVNDFWINIDGWHEVRFSGISFDILDCILFSYISAFKLKEERLLK